MSLLTWTTRMLEFLGGSRDEAPAGFPALPKPLLLGAWWGVLCVIIYIFCGQSSKFIYIDF